MTYPLDVQHTKQSCPTVYIRADGSDRRGSLFPEGNLSAFRKTNVQGQQVAMNPDCEVIPDTGPGASVWIVKSGILRLQRYRYDGKRQILSLSFAGEVLGYERGWRDGMSVETATACNLCRVDRRDLDAVLHDDADLRDAIYLQQHDQLERLRWLTWSIGALRPDERLSGFLALATRFMPYQPLPDGTGVLSILLSRLDIADLLATTVESISRIIHRLAEMNIVETRDRGHLRLLDLAALKTLGGIDQSFDTLPFCDRFRGGLLNAVGH